MLRTIAIFLFATKLSAEVIITPGVEQKAIADQVLDFTANVDVTWSMGAGSLGSIDSDGHYTAPATVPVFHPAGGCTIMSGNSIYNHRIDSLPVHTDSAAIISRIGQVGPQWTGVFPINTVTTSTYVARALSFYYAGITTPGFYLPVQSSPNSEFGIESGWFSWDTAGDRHAIQIVRPTCEIQEIYNYFPVGTVTTDPGCGWGAFCAQVNAVGGGIYPAASTSASAGVDAAGIGSLPLILNYDEILSGEIKHMLRMTVNGGGCVFWPAQSGPICMGTTTNSPYGAVYRLKATKLAALIAGGLNATETVLATQLNHYGLINTDVGYAWQVSIVDEWKPPSFAAASTHLNSILTATDFEIVDQSGLMVAADSLDTTDTAELVIATDPMTMETAQVRVNLQGIAIGRDHVSETFIAGAPALQLSSWVTGASDTSITWTMDPTLGTLSGSGLYTPPGSVVSLSNTIVTATSVANPSLSTTIGITVVPAGTFRVRCGGTSDYTDTDGHVWLGDQVAGRPLIANAYSGAYYDHFSYGLNWVDAGNATLYNRQCSTNGKDPMFRLHVPNGNYVVGALATDTSGSVNGRDHANYEVNGITLWEERDSFTDAGGYLRQLTYNTPVTVSDGQIYLAQRRRGLATDVIDYHDDYRTIYHSNLTFPEFVGMTVTLSGSCSGLSLAPTTHHSPLEGDSGTIAVTVPDQTCLWAAIPSDKWITTFSSATGDGTISYTVAPAVGDERVGTITVSGQTFTITEDAIVGGGVSITPTSPSSIKAWQAQQFTGTIVLGGTLIWNIQSGPGTVDSNGLYFPPSSIPSNTSAVIRATNVADGTKYAEVTQSLLQSDVADMPAIGVRTGCGSCNYTDGDMNVWHGDDDASPNVSLVSAGSGENTGLTIGGSPTDSDLYTTRRYAYGLVRYLFALPPNSYTLRLLWNSTNTSTSDSDKINVLLNGSLVITGLNLNTVAGGENLPYSVSLPIVVDSSRSLTLDFIPTIGSGNWPHFAGISAIQVVPEGSGCTYNLGSNSANAIAAGESNSTSVTTGVDCNWSATSNVAWITTSASGTGNGTAGYTVAANTGGLRSGTLTIAGQVFTVTQAAASSIGIGPKSIGLTPTGTTIR